jgi:hypothetical protein
MKIFICHSHRDEGWLNRLKIHLEPLERANLIEVWDDSRIKAGQDWDKEIKDALAFTDIVILLITADFMASDFIQTTELPLAMEASRAKGAVILSLIVSPSRLLRVPLLRSVQPINSPDKPLSAMTWAEQEETFDKLSQRIEEILRLDSKSSPDERGRSGTGDIGHVGASPN